MPNRDDSTPSDQKARKPIGPFVAFFFGRLFPLIFIALGIAATVGTTKNLRTALASAMWPTTEATIVASEYEQVFSPDSGSSTNSYEYPTTIRYTYTVDGDSFTNNRITFPAFVPTSRDAAERITARYPLNEKVEVAYNPDDPGNSVLEPGTSFSSWLNPVFGLVFFFVGLIAAWLIPSGIKERNESIRSRGAAPNLE